MEPQKILLCESESKDLDRLKSELKESKWIFSQNGKEAQSAIYKNKDLDFVILDLELRNYTGMEVLRYLKMIRVGIPVIISAKDDSVLKELGLDQNKLHRLGIRGVIKKPITRSKIEDFFKKQLKTSLYGHSTAKASEPDKEMAMPDSKFTRQALKDFRNSSVTLFDYYLKIGANKYIKIFNAGENFEQERITKYESKFSLEHLYFLTSDRSIFITYLNDQTEKMLKSSLYSSAQKLEMTKSLVDQFVDEVYTVGIDRPMLLEAKRMTGNIYDMVKRDQSISQYIERMERDNPEQVTDQMLAALFSSLIVSRLSWGSKSTAEKVVMGALLSEIGTLRLPATIRNKSPEQLTEAEKVEWKRHPQHGVDMLDSCHGIPEAVKQIVYQHHEYINGTGFPNKLTGMKIFPLAKVVSFVEAFVRFIRSEKLGPREGIRAFYKKRENLEKFDPLVLKAFVSSFVTKEIA